MNETDTVSGIDIEDLTGPLIMILDDDQFSGQLCMTFLRHHHPAVFFSNPDDAVAFSKVHALGVILLDIDLGGGLRGEEVLAALRQSELNRNTPVIAVTGFTDEAEKREILQAGFTGFLPKPFTRNEILQLIRDFIPDS
ncbi:MAG TPA: response regulator [Bacteroidales bacterium]|nr:response regulator [Bacteroidales bacterium]HSA42740.1 response regulator [Bacteroidales bacterium]